MQKNGKFFKFLALKNWFFEKLLFFNQIKESVTWGYILAFKYWKLESSILNRVFEKDYFNFLFWLFKMAAIPIATEQKFCVCFTKILFRSYWLYTQNLIEKYQQLNNLNNPRSYTPIWSHLAKYQPATPLKGRQQVWDGLCMFLK